MFGTKLSNLVRRSAGTGTSPEVLVLASDPDRLAGDGGPTAVSPRRIIDLLRRNELDLGDLTVIVAFVPTEGVAQYVTDLGFILSKAPKFPQSVLLSEEELDREEIERLPIRRMKSSDLRHQLSIEEGRIIMANPQRDQHIADPEELKDQLKELIRTIHDEEDPHELTAYKKFVKKHVSVFSRAYLTAYLVKTLVEGNGAPSRPRRERRPVERSNGRSGGNRKADEQVGNVAPEDRKTLFVSVGKNRRVYPKDFIALFAEIDGVEGDDIGQIKILDNYSFVEVDKSVADTIIDRYNGYDFRGRKLTVNFARNKKE